jgi:hypothetical protein
MANVEEGSNERISVDEAANEEVDMEETATPMVVSTTGWPENTMMLLFPIAQLQDESPAKETRQ